MTTRKTNPRLPKLPLVLLALLSLASFGGPFLLLIVVQGGERAKWPPDRAVEWWTIGLTIGLVVVLMVACVTASLWVKRGQG